MATALDPDAAAESLTEAIAVDDSPVFVADAQSIQLMIEPRLDQLSTSNLEITEQVLNSSDLSKRNRLIIWALPGLDIWDAYLPDEDQQESLIRAAGVLDSQAELIGWSELLRLPEIQAINFLFYDGESWIEQWDSSESETLPGAIEVTIEIAISQSTDEKTKLKTASFSRKIIIPGSRFSATVEDVE